MNLLCLCGWITGNKTSWEIVTTFLAATYKGEERHRRRLLKIEQLEKGA
jgi:ribose 5-phosphate isomerase B